MPWSREQVSEILESYWRVGGASCPIDQSILNVQHIPYMGGYGLLAECPYCGEAMQTTNSDDPLAGQFREWTPEEVEAMVRSYYQTRQVNCPVCSASVNAQNIPTMDANLLLLNCPRCMNHHNETRPRR